MKVKKNSKKKHNKRNKKEKNENQFPDEFLYYADNEIFDNSIDEDWEDNDGTR